MTFVAGTEQSRFLEDFKRLNFNVDRVNLVKLFVREPDPSGIDKSITVEFGQSVNWAMCQGVSEAWALGELERLKRDIRRFSACTLRERSAVVSTRSCSFAPSFSSQASTTSKIAPS